jgi:hypothetical protein
MDKSLPAVIRADGPAKIVVNLLGNAKFTGLGQVRWIEALDDSWIIEINVTDCIPSHMQRRHSAFPGRRIINA